jgi:hypothetical protein
MKPIHEWTPEQQQELTNLIESLNTTLLDESADSAETAFNISCFLSVLVIIVSALLALILHHWITAVLVLVMTTLLATGVSTLLAMRARTGNLTVTYERLVIPQIDTALDQYDITRQQFEDYAITVLPKGAPLGQYFSSSPIVENDSVSDT